MEAPAEYINSLSKSLIGKSADAVADELRLRGTTGDVISDMTRTIPKD